jgi:hypothetical protein
MEHGFKSTTVIDRYVGRVAAPPSGLVACLTEAYRKGLYRTLPEWAAALLFRIG